MTFRKNRLDEALALAGRDRAESLAGLLEGRVLGTFGRDAELDPLDVLAAGSVGAVGAALDVLLVAVPKSVTYLRRHEQHGSVLTQLFKAWIVPSDNALAAESKVPFDAVGGEPKVPGMFPGNHRFMTPGHDPVLGLAVGVHDILRGGRTAIGTDGRLRFDEISGESVSGLGSALVVELLHLLSDVATKAGLPAPFTTAAGLLRLGSFGENQRTVADLARYMYLEGYDLRHFVTTCTVPSGILARSRSIRVTPPHSTTASGWRCCKAPALLRRTSWKAQRTCSSIGESAQRGRHIGAGCEARHQLFDSPDRLVLGSRQHVLVVLGCEMSFQSMDGAQVDVAHGNHAEQDRKAAGGARCTDALTRGGL